MGIHQSKHSRKLSELQKLSHFDKREFQRWHEAFIAECPGGRMDRTHFTALYTQLFQGSGDPRELAFHAFDLFDDDKSGYIDFEEFIGTLSTTMRGTLEEKLTWLFQLYDIDKDGTITYKEMVSIVKANHKVTSSVQNSRENEPTPEERVDMVFGIMNKDRNSTISLGEFLHYSKNPTVISELSLLDSHV